MEHEAVCHCALCRSRAEGLSEAEAMEGYKAWEREMMEKHGWYVHFVQDERYPTGVNYHTHGILESFNHVDLQITCPLSPKVANNILASIVDRIKDGITFVDGDMAPKIVKGYHVKFIASSENDRPVLRVIMPDEAGHLEKDEMTGSMALQYEEC